MSDFDPGSNPGAADDPASRPAAEIVATLVENHRRFLAFLERRVGSRETAEDILQDAFVRGIQRADQVVDAESAVAWFYRLLRNALVDHWRRQGATRRAEERLTVLSESESGAPDEELMETVCGCAGTLAATLKPEYAIALRRVDLEGTSVQEFAREAGITANNASVRLHRARAALLRQVQRSCGTCAEHGCLDCECGGPAAGSARP